MIDRALQDKWEKKLQRAGLGIDQSMTDNSEGELQQVKARARKVQTVDSSEHERLRLLFDGSDSFMDGFEIKSIRSLEREIPEWALSNNGVQRVLMTAFPKLSLTPPEDKRGKRTFQKRIKKAGRWVRVIYLYYRMQLPRQIVAKEVGIDEGTLKSLLRNIDRVSRGLTADGGGKRKNATPPSPSVVTGEKGDEAK